MNHCRSHPRWENTVFLYQGTITRKAHAISTYQNTHICILPQIFTVCIAWAAGCQAAQQHHGNRSNRESHCDRMRAMELTMYTSLQRNTSRFITTVAATLQTSSNRNLVDTKVQVITKTCNFVPELKGLTVPGQSTRRQSPGIMLCINKPTNNKSSIDN